MKKESKRSNPENKRRLEELKTRTGKIKEFLGEVELITKDEGMTNEEKQEKEKGRLFKFETALSELEGGGIVNDKIIKNLNNIISRLRGLYNLEPLYDARKKQLDNQGLDYEDDSELDQLQEGVKGSRGDLNDLFDDLYEKIEK